VIRGTRSLPPVVLAEEDLDGAPRGLYGDRVGTGVGVDEVDGLVDGVVRDTL